MLTLVVTGCSTEPEVTEAAPDAGYQSGDGTTTTWAPAERGKPVSLVGSDFEGRTIDTTAWLGAPVVVNTWYAACPPCRAEAPDLVQIAHDYSDRDVRLLGINRVDTAGAAQAFQRTFEVPYPSIQDTDSQAMARLQSVVPVQAVPTTVVLDAEGRVAARVVGLVEAPTLRAMIDDVLAETGPGGAPTASNPTPTARS